ncbi:hypothetical protein Pyn_34081 [Prunus yedoensis var. nudiflora]|uniref:Uncharacterized protein n=1 Tax=Prunus yedoensis var. nudiflora TaxID=2094558 RepID=A0A314XIW2_PRUYE|nr:hypothetical protein Pyn_34081 [Prunus yedoensis var. nudiflora]
MGHKPLWRSTIDRGAEDAGISGSAIIVSPGRNNVRQDRALDFSADIFKLSLKGLGPSFNRGRGTGGH